MNQITLPVAELKQALAGFSKIVSRKSSLPVLQTVKLSRTAEGRVSLSATDLDAFVTYQVESSQPGAAGAVLLPYEQLNKTARGMTGDVTVIAEAKDKVKLRYQIGDSPLEQSVATLPVDEFPPVPQMAAAAVRMPANFGATLRQALETSSTDSSRHVLQGAYLDVAEPNCHSIVSTNGRALFAANTFTFDLKEPLNIPRHKFLMWAGFLAGECELAVKAGKTNGGWVQLTTPRWQCIIKPIEGPFPKWRQVVPADTESWTKVLLSVGAITQMLNLSTKLPGDDTEHRTLQLRVDSGLHLEGRNKDDREFTSAVIADVKIFGKPVTTALNREYLQTALRGGLNEIRIHSELDPLLFCRPGQRMVIMPVRVPAVPAAPVTKPEPSPAPETIPTPTPAPVPNPAEERKTQMPEPTKPTEPSAVDQIESVKAKLRELLGELNNLAGLIKQADRDKRNTEKEVASVRQTIRSLQGLKL